MTVGRRNGHFKQWSVTSDADILNDAFRFRNLIILAR
jgi:hypothetical protein